VCQVVTKEIQNCLHAPQREMLFICVSEDRHLETVTSRQ
jgi:hypothetical protein